MHQSAEPPRRHPKPREDAFEVCVIGHLREVKDPFRTAEAARLLPAESRVRVLQAGAAEPRREREAWARLLRELAREGKLDAGGRTRSRNHRPRPGLE